MTMVTEIGAGVTVIAREATFVMSATEVAVTVAVTFAVTEAGAS